MNFKTNLLLLTIIIFSSCGPTKDEEQVKQKAIIDSVVNATKNEIENEIRFKDSIEKATQDKNLYEKALADSIQISKQILKEQLIELKSELAGAEEKLNSIKSFQIGRTSDEKANQIQQQTLIIEKIKSVISDKENLLQR